MDEASLRREELQAQPDDPGLVAPPEPECVSLVDHRNDAADAGAFPGQRRVDPRAQRPRHARIDGSLSLAEDQDGVAEERLQEEGVEAHRRLSLAHAPALRRLRHRSLEVLGGERHDRLVVGDDAHVEAGLAPVPDRLEQVDLALADAVLRHLASRLLALGVPLARLRQQELPPLAKDAIGLAEDAGDVGDMVQGVDDHDGVHRSRRDRQGRHVPRNRAEGEVLAGEAVAADPQERRGDVEGDRPIAELRQEIADPGRAAPQVQDEAVLRDAHVLGHGEKGADEAHVLLAVDAGEGFRDVVVGVLLGGVAQDLGFSAVGLLGDDVPREEARPGGRVARGRGRARSRGSRGKDGGVGGGQAPQPLE